ncbi:MAG: hypothetical protein KVP17_001701 [Porospora cf. gigantea B]|uniref:uncharacterized protein n=1 Tax=Porospora cf. gigantea B TaxID=2853592 RepID=UPI003571A64E|nr:MAG: hypothetical protein KVP17_001701 [Porospora cf. gigantea B]
MRQANPLAPLTPPDAKDDARLMAEYRDLLVADEDYVQICPPDPPSSEPTLWSSICGFFGRFRIS